VRAPALDEQALREIALSSESRVELWARFVAAADAREIAEIGVYRGEFAAALLERCPMIRTYYMIDPWRRLRRWNKPANARDRKFGRIFSDAMARTQPFESKRVVLRGRTVKMARRIPDGSLDFAYVDGDHTLRGIAIDLINVYPKLRAGGWLGGDDFSPTIWQHDEAYEPTLVFPFAVHFAEAVGARIYVLPHQQFLIHKGGGGFKFVDFTGAYGSRELRPQLVGR
jgi:hypothetical protein